MGGLRRHALRMQADLHAAKRCRQSRARPSSAVATFRPWETRFARLVGRLSPHFERAGYVDASRSRRCAARHQRLSALLYGKNRSPLQLRCPRQRVIFFGWTCLALHRSRLQHLFSTTRRLSVICRPLHEGPKSIRYRWISHNNDIAPSKKM